MIADLFKAMISAAAIPIAAAVDLLLLPCTAYEDRPPFENAEAFAKSSKEALKKVIGDKNEGL